MKIRKFLFYTGIALLALFCFWYFYLRTERENRLVEEGNVLVKRIDDYQKKNGRLPDSLAQIGIHNKNDFDSYGEGADAIYYEKKDSTHFVIYFATSFDETHTYYSDSKKWEDLNRDMK